MKATERWKGCGVGTYFELGIWAHPSHLFPGCWLHIRPGLGFDSKSPSRGPSLPFRLRVQNLVVDGRAAMAVMDSNAITFHSGFTWTMLDLVIVKLPLPRDAIAKLRSISRHRPFWVFLANDARHMQNLLSRDPHVLVSLRQSSNHHGRIGRIWWQ